MLPSKNPEDVFIPAAPALGKSKQVHYSTLFRGHGREIRGLDRADRSPTATGYFGRMFRTLPAAFHKPGDLDKLGTAMVVIEEPVLRPSGLTTPDAPIEEAEPEEENRTIPAGYTYLGQFIDHDISFDPNSSLQKINDPDAQEDFRTPRLDLDSVYGRGPDDQPYMYSRESGFTEFLIGRTLDFDLKPTADQPDLARNGQNVALIGDKRNDENMLVTQIHRVFLQLHNKVIREFSHIHDEKLKFRAAQRQVRFLYQWMIVHDFLPRVCGQKSVDKVLDGFPHGDPCLPHYHPKSGQPFMPVEFSVAAYRFGHSMVRPSYSLNDIVRKGSDDKFSRVPIFSAEPDRRSNLNGFDFLPSFWNLDFTWFFDEIPATPVPGLQIPQPSYRIDTELVEPLANLPEFREKFLADPGNPNNIPNPAQRNLRRGIALQLPSGQAVARRLGLAVLSDKELWDDAAEGGRLKAVFDACPGFKQNAPLWFYILREAGLTKREGVTDAKGGHHLGPVGAQIVAEVFIGMLWYDSQSYFKQDAHFTPDAPYTSTKGQFNIPDLIHYATA